MTVNLPVFFKEHNFLIGISLDGNATTNNRYRCDKNGNSVLPQILTAVSLLKKHGVDFNILSVIDDENAKDISMTLKYFMKHGFKNLQFIPYVDEGNSISLSENNYEYFLKTSFDFWYEEFINGNFVSVRHIDNYIGILTGNPPENCAMCGTCGHYYVIEANGDIYPCDFYCKEEFRLGSIFDENPFISNEKHKDYIEKSYLIHEKCKDCKYYILCRGGCRRDRTDDYMQNKYCKSYYNFFDYAADRMAFIARSIKNE